MIKALQNEWNLFDDEEEARRWVNQQMVCPTVDSRQWLVCLLEEQAYALPVDCVVEMVRYTAVTPLPRAWQADGAGPAGTFPAWLAGACNLRGEVIPVLDVRVRFGLPPGKCTAQTILVVVQVTHPPAVGEAAGGPVRKQVGLLVDAVAELLYLRNEEIQPPATALTAPAAVDGRPLLSGVVQGEERALRLLDVDTLLSREEMLATIAGHAGGPGVRSA
ncbi:MAG: chemotaxis protein CheW [Magnetococcus sp. DMHC-8]